MADTTTLLWNKASHVSMQSRITSIIAYRLHTAQFLPVKNAKSDGYIPSNPSICVLDRKTVIQISSSKDVDAPGCAEMHIEFESECGSKQLHFRYYAAAES